MAFDGFELAHPGQVPFLLSSFYFLFFEPQRFVVPVEVIGGGLDPAFGQQFADGFGEALVGDGRARPTALAAGGADGGGGGVKVVLGGSNGSAGASPYRGGVGVKVVRGARGLKFQDAATAA
jgi:hypothetical protein